MDPTSLAAIASVLGAATFFGAGYVFAPRQSTGTAEDEFESDVTRHASMPSLLGPSRDQPLARLLAVASERTHCQTMAVFDDEGLLIEGHDPDGALGAAVGTLAHAVGGVSSFVRGDTTAHDLTVGSVRVSPMKCGDTTMWLATLAGNSDLTRDDRGVLATAVQRLLGAPAESAGASAGASA